MRTIKELLEVLRDRKDLFDSGLCVTTVVMKNEDIITVEEMICLRRYFYANIPPLGRLGGYAWPEHKWEPRLAWLNEQIEKLEKEENHVPM